MSGMLVFSVVCWLLFFDSFLSLFTYLMDSCSPSDSSRAHCLFGISTWWFGQILVISASSVNLEDATIDASKEHGVLQTQLYQQVMSLLAKRQRTEKTFQNETYSYGKLDNTGILNQGTISGDKGSSQVHKLLSRKT